MKTVVLLLTLSLFVISSGVSAANAAVQPRIETQPGFARTEDLSISAAPVSFAGTWQTLAGGSHQYTVILEQIGNNVTGSYSPGNGKIFDGVVTDNKLTFKWTQDGGFEGTAEFTMDEGGKGFTGSSTALKPKEFTVTWNTYIPPVISFAGTWETISNGQHHFALIMVQTGTKVTGIYPRGNGKLEGTVSGRVLRFKWESDGGTGSGRLVMDESGKAFSGTYNKGDNPDDVLNTWNGKLPAVSADKAPEKVTPPEEVTPPLASFAGVWQAKFGEGVLELILQQAGDQVTGQVKVNSADVGVIRESSLAGNTLRFKIVRAGRALANGTHSPDEYMGIGELVLDAGGKSFTGHVLGTITSGGTLIGH